MNPVTIQAGKIFQLSNSANVQSRTFEMQAIFQTQRIDGLNPECFAV
jgi:hypothetical protein